MRNEIQSKIEDQIPLRAVLVIESWIHEISHWLRKSGAEDLVQEESSASSQHYNSSSLNGRKVGDDLSNCWGEIDTGTEFAVVCCGVWHHKPIHLRQ